MEQFSNFNDLQRAHKTARVFLGFIGLAVVILTGGCVPDSGESTDMNKSGRDRLRVTGEIESANSTFFGPPSIPNIGQYTISFMAPEGRVVKAGTPILKFNPQELEAQLRDKSNKLNEKQKQLEKQEIVAREVVAELKLKLQEAVADLDKARLKADIPVELLASRDYRENKLVLKQAELTLAFREEDIQKEQRVQDTEIDILKREISVLQSEVAQVQGSIDSMTIKSAGPGVVIHTVNHRNNKHEVGDNVWMGRRVMELPDLTQLQVHLEVPERESARITVGQRVKFVLDAAPDQQFFGEITELASVIHTKSPNQPARVFDAIVSLKTPDSSVMRPGMSVTAEIHLNTGIEEGS
jgi:HlyD family secretion protein